MSKKYRLFKKIVEDDQTLIDLLQRIKTVLININKAINVTIYSVADTAQMREVILKGEKAIVTNSGTIEEILKKASKELKVLLKENTDDEILKDLGRNISEMRSFNTHLINITKMIADAEDESIALNVTSNHYKTIIHYLEQILKDDKEMESDTKKIWVDLKKFKKESKF